MKEIRDQLGWLRRSKDCPTSPSDRTICKLYYGEQKTEMGRVCETADGRYWSFTTNPSIECQLPEVYLIKYDTLESACKALKDYVVSEVYRLIQVGSNMPYELSRKLKKRDKEAFAAYQDAIQDEVTAFKAGIEWILRSEGFPRRPDWAKYLVQSNNGDFVWFESQPVIDHDLQIWTASTGRAQVVRTENWRTSLTRLT